MTSHYIDITALPCTEINTMHLLGATYDKLHLALVKARINSIGVSFPKYQSSPRSIGAVLRLHGGAQALNDLMGSDWLRALNSHVRITDIAQVPLDASHRTVQRKQFKTSVDRLRRRRMRRKGETLEQVEKAIPSTVERHPNLPYVQLHSRSTGQPFCLFVALGPIQSEATPGTFSSYGLSGTSTVPWF